jgi:hypothetical protein
MEPLRTSGAKLTQEHRRAPLALIAQAGRTGQPLRAPDGVGHAGARVSASSSAWMDRIARSASAAP